VALPYNDEEKTNISCYQILSIQTEGYKGRRITLYNISNSTNETVIVSQE
jgi:hypothetical protein